MSALHRQAASTRLGVVGSVLHGRLRIARPGCRRLVHQLRGRTGRLDRFRLYVVGSGIEDDPQFKRLDSDSQKLVKQIMDNVENAAAAERAAQQTTPPAAPTSPKKDAKPDAAVKAQAGCPADAPKKSRFHLPKALQDAVNKGKLGDLPGMNIDPNAKKDTPKDANGKPCPPSPAPAKSTGK